MTWKDKRYIAANTHRVEECKSNHVPYDDRSALYAPNLFLIGSFREVMHTYYWFEWSIVITAEPRLSDSIAASRDDLFLSHDSSFYLKTENCFIHDSLLLEE